MVTTDEAQLKAVPGSFDFIIDAVSAKHDLNMYLSLLATDGIHILLGVPAEPYDLAAFSVLTGRKSVVGSSIGGIAETQEMLGFAAEHGIVSDIELINIKDSNTAYERMLKGDVRYRFVLDIATL
ncbi:zinc-binding dehydrogenase [Hymenobacter cellulosivorans]|uniref:zinc-binding dehydrogenase n=1 Tax=Hymenobacter cellulosivorans TaxID=2932249 RepID=UPI0035CA4BBC